MVMKLVSNVSKLSLVRLFTLKAVRIGKTTSRVYYFCMKWFTDALLTPVINIFAEDHIAQFWLLPVLAHTSLIPIVRERVY